MFNVYCFVGWFVSKCNWNLSISCTNNSVVFVRSYRGLQLLRAFHWGTHSREESNFSEFRRQISSSYLGNEPSDEEVNSNNFVVERRSVKDKNEMQRRRKIGLANKGRVPWNKGKKHTAETRELISQRTKEALSDPKVRKKMSECPRTLSDQTKDKIRVTITRQWKERRKWKRSRERFISKWAESIAEAAKKGGHGQQELDWDSYEKIEREIAFQQLQRSADKAKAKEMARIRAERRAKAKSENVRTTLKKRVAKVKGLAMKKSKEEKEELAAAEDLKLKERLTKIHRKKSLNKQLSSRDHRAWERLDLKFLKRDIREEDVSLADQIRDVKNKKAELIVSDNYTP
ncbi:uncharacterized protein [Rutidosis leptorrhynchoides]|uniref:uncharacterized protein n=1 Tax=Rutidosis leptorrhynchoides TaxID=125765 RepID=UPI003A99679C